MAARIDREAFQEVAEKEDKKQENAEAADQRVDVLERDLTRLTIVVEQVAKSQQQQQQDLTKATLILERIAEKVGPLN